MATLINISIGLHPDQIGGAYRVAAGLGDALADQGHTVLSVAPGTRRGTRTMERRTHHLVHRYGHDGSGGMQGLLLHWQAVRSLTRQLIRSHRPDAVIAHFPTLGLAAFDIPEAAALPRIYGFYGPLGREYRATHQQSAGIRSLAYQGMARLLDMIEHRALRRATGIYILSEFSRTQLAGVHPSLGRNALLVRPGIDAASFPAPTKPKAHYRQRHGLPWDGNLLLSVRRLDRRMGLDLLLEACGRLAPSHPDLRCVLVGDGPCRGELQEQAKSLGIEDRVYFAGRVPEEDLPDYYHASDLFVLPTRALEGFGMVILEALASGVPVLGTPIGAIPEVLAPLDARLVLPGASAQAIATGIQQFMADPASRPIPEQCRAYALGRYRWEQLARDVLELTLAGRVRAGDTDAVPGNG